MSDLLLIVLVLGGGLAFVAGVAYLLQRRVETEGPLFAAPASPTLRVLALVMGLLFGAFFLLEFFYTDAVHVVIPILALALLAYSLGAGRVLRSIQGNKEQQAPERRQDESQSRE